MNIFRKKQLINYPIYDLVGVIHHYGERTNSGHYTATTRNPVDYRWRNFDDVKVTFAHPADLRSSTNAYLLFYERRLEPSTSSGPAAWFPYGVPEQISAMYTEEARKQLRREEQVRS